MLKNRLNQLKRNLQKEKLDAVFVSSVSNIEYLTGYSNFSKDEREAYLFVGHGFEYVITDGRYSEAIGKEVPHLKLFERGRKRSVEYLFKKHKKEIKTLGIEEDNLTVAEFKKVKKHFKNIKHFNVGHLRSIKEKWELERIKKASALGDKAFKYILQKIKLEISEKELAYELEKFIKENGADLAFPPIVAFGKNSSVPHHQIGNKQLTIHDKLILLDFGVKVDSYCSDMTRTVFFGKVTQKHKRIYQVVLEAQKKAVEFINKSIKSGKKIMGKDVDRVARQYIISHGFPTIPHSLGHGIGLEVHEHPLLSPKSRDILKEGMVFSIEPGVYIPDFGSPRSTQVEVGGVRIEDLFVLEKSGLKKLTNSPHTFMLRSYDKCNV